MWAKGKGEKWCDFWKLDLDKLEGESGVYVIWIDSVVPYAIYVGQGNIADRIENHRGKDEFISYRNDGEKMFVTWQAFPDEELKGREAYLADLLKPKIGERHPKVKPVKTDPPAPLRKRRRLRF